MAVCVSAFTHRKSLSFTSFSLREFSTYICCGFKGGLQQVEPQAQLTYQTKSYRGFDDKISHVDGFTSQGLRGRIGTRLAWSDKTATGSAKGNTFYLNANVLHDFIKPATVKVDGVEFSENIGEKSWLEVGVGGQFNINQNSYLYGNLQYQQGFSSSDRKGTSASVRASLYHK